MAPPKRRLSSSPEKERQRPPKEQRIGDEIPEFVPTPLPPSGFTPHSTRFPTLFDTVAHENGGEGVSDSIPTFVPPSPLPPGFTPDVTRFPTLFDIVAHAGSSGHQAADGTAPRTFVSDTARPDGLSVGLQHETRDGDGQSASHNQGGEELAVANRAESDNGDAAADTTPLHGTLIASTQEDFNPWIKQREPRRRSYRVRKPPAPFSKDEYDGKITVCVTSTLDESVFDSEDAEELVDYIHTMLYSLFCAEENLKVEDWKGVQEAFEPMLRTRRTLLRVFLEDFFDVEFKPKKKSTRKQPKGKWVRSGKMLALSGRGLPENFEQAGLSIRGYVPRYEDKLRFEVVLCKDDPLYEVWYLLARDVYVRNVQPIQNHWPGYPPDEPEATEDEEAKEVVRDSDLDDVDDGDTRKDSVDVQMLDAAATHNEGAAVVGDMGPPAAPVTPATPVTSATTATPVGSSGRDASDPAMQTRRSGRTSKVVKYTK